MAYYNYFFIFIITVLGSNFVESAEFVPLYMWSRNKVSEHVPALHKISQDSFKDTLLEYLKENPYIIVFVEPTLSPEDFAQHDQHGKIAFPNIYGLKQKKIHVTYKPYVQNPVGVIKHLNIEVTELSIKSLLSSSNVPKNNILIIDLNDAKEDEPRFDMLKRHDHDIVLIYEDILEQHDNVLAIYTANHTAWVAPEDIRRTKSRNLLAADEGDKDTSLIFRSDNTILYLSSDGNYMGNNKNVTIDSSFTMTKKGSEENFLVDLTGKDLTISFNITSQTKQGYWYINSILVDNEKLPGIKDFFAPSSFSFHCSTFKYGNSKMFLRLPGFQFQPDAANLTFGDAYDCTGFTSVPIWSGLFVTFIMLIIVTFGLTMMMDIRTMDRFDDPKGKTITVTASE